MLFSRIVYKIIAENYNNILLHKTFTTQKIVDVVKIKFSLKVLSKQAIGIRDNRNIQNIIKNILTLVRPHLFQIFIVIKTKYICNNFKK